ncbi:hypothetical protein GHK65_08025 [Sinorhizobium meliloti]|nr:hypothetical protein [Sinorhizobium meliloti]
MFEAISQYLADTPHLQSLRRHPVPSSSRRRKKLHTSRTPTPDAFRWGRHHLGIRGRLFLGIGGRDHFGIRGRIASEFADCISGPCENWSRSSCRMERLRLSGLRWAAQTNSPAGNWGGPSSLTHQLVVHSCVKSLLSVLFAAPWVAKTPCWVSAPER